MDIADFIVLGFTAAVFAFLVWIEIKSRRNKTIGETVRIPLGIDRDEPQRKAGGRA